MSADYGKHIKDGKKGWGACSARCVMLVQLITGTQTCSKKKWNERKIKTKYQKLPLLHIREENFMKYDGLDIYCTGRLIAS